MIWGDFLQCFLFLYFNFPVEAGRAQVFAEPEQENAFCLSCQEGRPCGSSVLDPSVGPVGGKQRLTVLRSRASQLMDGWRQPPFPEPPGCVDGKSKALGAGRDAEKHQIFAMNGLDYWIVHQSEWWAGKQL